MSVPERPDDGVPPSLLSPLLPVVDRRDTVGRPAGWPARSGLNLFVGFIVIGLLALLAQGPPTSATIERSVRIEDAVDGDGDASQVPDRTEDGEDAPQPFMPGAAEPTTSHVEITTTEPATADWTSDPTTSTATSSTDATTTGASTGAPSTGATSTVPTASTGDGPSRDVPNTTPEADVDSAPPVPGPWAAVTHTTAAGFVTTELGCANGTSAGALDAFFRERVGPLIGEDYQHVYALGGGRYLWLFQDAFIDPTGIATRLDQAPFVHNVALVQDGGCFTMFHRGTDLAPRSFEQGSGEQPLASWFWPMGGESIGGQVVVFWAEMRRDGYTPGPVDGLGWHPVRTWIGAYDSRTLQRLSFAPAPDSGVSPIFGYAVASQGEWTYLFGNTFEQNLVREGGYSSGPHSATAMWLARVPLGQFGTAPEYRTVDGWSADRSLATPIMQRYWVENPVQPRYLGGQWVAVTKVDGYWGEQLAVDVAIDPWGPWTTVDVRAVSPRGGDPKMNTYHAHLMPWLDGGSLVVSISQNARNMTRDAYPVPARYRPGFFSAALVAPPPPPPPAETPETSTTSTTLEETSTTVGDTTTTEDPTTTSSTSSTTSTSTSTTSTSTTSTSTTTSSTTVPDTTTSSSTTTTVAQTTTTAGTTTTTAATTTTVAVPTTTVAPPSTAATSSTTSSSSVPPGDG